MSGFHSGLADQLTAFVAFKRSLGFQYQAEAKMLQRFDRWMLTQPGDHRQLTQSLVEEWTTPGPMEGARTNAQRVGMMRHLGLYLNTMGHDAYIAEPLRPTRHYTFVPHIFTVHELDGIFTEADRLPPHRRSTLPIVLPVILRVLYGCGLRISEATQLEVQHVHWEDGVLEIRDSKFGKDRLTPMSETLATVCQGYMQAVHASSPPTAYFFCHRDGGPVSPDTIYRRFRDVLWQAGIAHRGKGQGPRVHDLRHSFAVHTLKAAVDRQIDIYAALPILSAYLGHASIAATEQYVRLTADVFPELRTLLDQATGWVIPEVAWE